MAGWEGLFGTKEILRTSFESSICRSEYFRFWGGQVFREYILEFPNWDQSLFSPIYERGESTRIRGQPYERSGHFGSNSFSNGMRMDQWVGALNRVTIACFRALPIFTQPRVFRHRPAFRLGRALKWWVSPKNFRNSGNGLMSRRKGMCGASPY